jgi:hypothetical protein
MTAMRARIALGALGLIAFAALAQRGAIRPPRADESSIPVRNGEFHFLRLEYTDLPQYHRGYGYSSREGMGSGWWMMDWPDADIHFSVGVQRLTRLDVGDPRHLRLTDDRIFNYPWIYATQTGWWGLTDSEIARLREYLQRGGFLVTDDFWGEEQWEIFRRTMERVFPGQKITDIADDDAVMHVLYDIGEKDKTFIPGSRHLYRGPGGAVQIVQPAGTRPAWRAILDSRERMVVAVNYDTDVADAWEFADAPYYPAAMTLLAYKYGINYIVYAMTH